MISAANKPTGESSQNMGKLFEDRQESLEKLFHAAYHIALRGRPYTDFAHELICNILILNFGQGRAF